MRKIFLIPLFSVLCTVMAWAGVAKIGTTEYETLNAAFTAAQNGDQIELLEDVTVTSVIGINSKNVTLHMHGHTITNSVTSNRLFRIYGDMTFTVVGNSDGISANAKMIIPNSNHGSYGFVDFRNTSGTASNNTGFVAYNVDFEGATCYGSFFVFRGPSNYQNILLQDCNVKMHKGDNATALTYKLNNDYVGDNSAFIYINQNCNNTVVRCIRGRYEFETWQGTSPAHNETPDMFQGRYGGVLELQGIELIANKGIIEVSYRSNTFFTDCKVITDGNTWSSGIIAPSGYDNQPGSITVNSGEYRSVYPIYVLTSGGTVNVNGGKFVAGDGDKSAVIRVSCGNTGAKESSDGVVNVIGGEFSGNFILEAFTNCPTPRTSTLNISGGTFTNVNSISLQNESCHLNITGGTFSGTAVDTEEENIVLSIMVMAHLPLKNNNLLTQPM